VLAVLPKVYVYEESLVLVPACTAYIMDGKNGKAANAGNTVTKLCHSRNLIKSSFVLFEIEQLAPNLWLAAFLYGTMIMAG